MLSVRPCWKSASRCLYGKAHNHVAAQQRPEGLNAIISQVQTATETSEPDVVQQGRMSAHDYRIHTKACLEANAMSQEFSKARLSP